MNFLQHFYPGDAAASFILRVLAEVTLVTAVALLVCRSVGRRNPALRHGICVCALICVLTAPVTTVALQQLGWTTLKISLESDAIARAADQAPLRRYEAIETAPQSFWTVTRARSAASLLLLVWTAGTALLLLRLGLGMRRVATLRRSARDLEHATLHEALSALRDDPRLPSTPVQFSRRIHGPVVVGPLQTTVILPEQLLDQLTATQLRSVLAHELNHVRQRDPLIGLVQRIVAAGYWPHPLVHLLNWDLSRAREEVCDNAAVRGTTAPNYADTLLTVALGIQTPRSHSEAIGLLGGALRLEERVKGLLDPQRRFVTTMKTHQIALVALTLTTGTGFIAGARVVAVPYAPNPQEIVEIHTSYSSKTKKVVVTAKKTKTAPVHTIKLAAVQMPKMAKSDVVYFERSVTSPAVSMTLQAVPAQKLPSAPEAKNVTITHVKVADPTLQVVPSFQIQSTTTTTTNGTTQTISSVPVHFSDSVQSQVISVPVQVQEIAVDPTKRDSTGSIQQSSTVTTPGDPAKRVGQPERTGPVRFVAADNRPQIIQWQNNLSDVVVRQVNSPTVLGLTLKQGDDVVRTFTAESKPDATVYIDGSDIKVVGDHVKIVYVHPGKMAGSKVQVLGRQLKVVNAHPMKPAATGTGVKKVPGKN